MQSALLFVDIQNDFCPGGALAVKNGDEVVGVSNNVAKVFDLVVASKDWHPVNHSSFVAQGGIWPPHCMQDTNGANFHPNLNRFAITAVFFKADTVEKDAYSSFEGNTETGVGLADYLRSRRVKKVFLTGLATDYCVKATALDAVREGFETYVITDGIRAVDVNPGDGDKALAEMEAAGVKLVTSHEVISARA